MSQEISSTATDQFVHLNVHSEFSLLDGIVRIPALAQSVHAMEMPAIALTDANNLFAAVKFYNAMLSKGIKPIIGADLTVEVNGKQSQITLLCQNNTGYINLCEIVSLAYTDGQAKGNICVQADWVLTRSEGLILVSNASYGLFSSALKKGEERIDDLKVWIDAFAQRFYFALSRVGRPHETLANHTACHLAATYNLPVLAVNDVRFLAAEDFAAHEVRVAIHDGFTLDDKRRPKKYTQQQYLRTPQEMCELFSDIPVAIQNTVELAKRCNLEMVQGNTVLPAFPVPAGQTTDEFLVAESKRLLEVKIRDLFTAEERIEKEKNGELAVFRERLDVELDVILGMGFPGYFLIVADFIQWAKNNDIPVGPGRGSGAGSLVAYVLEITDLNPLDYDLLFERFLNPERVSMPDFDIDFCIEGRDKVIDYVAQKYGRNHVSQIITFGTMAAKAVVRDVARVQGHSYGFADRIAKLIPFTIGISLQEAIDEVAELKHLYEEDDDVSALLNMALSLEGISRNAGKHAGGIVIAPNKLTDFMPIFCEEGGQENPVCQFDKDDAEKIGLVKFDFLGLKTLTIIKNAVTLIKQDVTTQQADLDITKLQLDDPKVYSFLSSGRTKAIFQLESAGMQKLIKELEPTTFDDVVALLALYRPGPLNAGMHHTFVARRHAREAVDYPHDMLTDILKPTYGVILYQEQVMQIAQVMGGYSLGGADLLRRAMGKKKREEMIKQREIFLAGSRDNQVEDKTANYVFDLMEKFADYGFNKSHSAAYALISYQTAWLKNYYPAHFMAAVMSADMDHTDKMVSLKRDCVKEFNLILNPPCVNASEYRFTVTGEREITYGLGAIKGVGHAVIDAIIAERKAGGSFENLLNFCERCAPAKLSRRTFEALIKAGALDKLGMNRASLMANLESAIQFGKQTQENTQSGMNDLFGFAPASSNTDTPGLNLIQHDEWKHQELMAAERASLGLYLSGHPVDVVADELKSMTGRDIKAIKDDAAIHIPNEATTEKNYQKKASMAVVAAGLVIEFRKRGNRVSLVLDDDTDRVEIGLFEKEFDMYRHVISKDKILVVSGKLAFDDFLNDYKLTADKIMDLEEARDQFAGRLVIKCEEKTLAEHSELVSHIKTSLDPHRNGNCKVQMYYSNSRSKAILQFGEHWKVKPNKLMVENLRKLFGKENVKIQYQRGMMDKLKNTG